MGRPRVVIESRRPSAAAAQAAALAAWHLEPVICSGPYEDGGGCPLLADEPCALLDGAAAVVYDLDLDDPMDREVLVELVAHRKGLPIITERSRAAAREHADVLDHCIVVVPYSARHTADAVVGALADARRPLGV